MNSSVLQWSAVESKAALAVALVDGDVAGELETGDPSAWGYFRFPNDKILKVGYADLGLLPVGVLVDKRVFVGIGEVLASFDIDTVNRLFLYRLPSVFHEFLSLADPLIVRDEVGFVVISWQGYERWKRIANGPIDKFEFDGARIHGTTIDGEVFSFTLP